MASGNLKTGNTEPSQYKKMALILFISCLVISHFILFFKKNNDIRVVVLKEGRRERKTVSLRYVSSSILKMRKQAWLRRDRENCHCYNPKYKQCPVAIETVGAVRAGAAHFPIHARSGRRRVTCPMVTQRRARPSVSYRTSFFKISPNSMKIFD